MIVVISSIRSGKGVPQIITAYRSAPGPDETLFIEDAFKDDMLWNSTLDAAGGSLAIYLQRSAVDEAQLVAALSAVEVCVINQVNLLNSGTALLSLSLYRPLIAPAAEANTGLADLCGPTWVRTFEVPSMAAS